MKSYLKWWVALALVSSVLPSSANADDNTSALLEASSLDTQQFSVLTYNVHGLPETMSPMPTTRNAGLISPLLNPYDVVLIQEDWFHHAALTSAVEHPFVSTPLKAEPTVIDPGDGLNLFSRFAFTDFERHAWTDCYGRILNQADCGADKGFTVAWIQLDVHTRIPVINLHMDAGRGDGDEDARRSQVEQLIAWIDDHTSTGPLIVAGDTNLHVDSSDKDQGSLDLLLKMGLVDVCDELSCGDSRIDRIFFRPGSDNALTPLSWSKPTLFVDDEAQALSDHLPVAVSFSWVDEPEVTHAE